MTTETASPVEGMSSVDLPADAPESFSSVNEAAAYFSELQEKRKQSTAESADTATAEPELAEKANADPETAPSGEPEADEPAEVPPIDPPRSWTKEEKEAFATWPREAQESAARVASTREAEFRRSQNEIAEERKAIKAEREAVEKVRQEYDTKLPALSKTLESALQNEFADIKSFDDLRILQRDDPFRYQQWDLRQKELSAVRQEEQAAEQRQAHQRMTKRSQYEVEQNKLLLELVPDMADPKKSVELRERAVTMLTDDLGMKRDQLERWMADDTGHEILSNAGFQKLVADRLKLLDIQSAPKAVAAKPLPPVQKPGTARSSGNALNEQIQALSKELDRTGDLKTAQKLYALQSRRAS